MTGSDILRSLKRVVTEYDADAAEAWARKAVEEGVDPIRAADVLSEAIREIGDGFGRGALFIPDLIGGAEAMKSAMRVLEDELKRRDVRRENLGTVVAGTVYGDIHDIGKTLVCTLLTTAGFAVYDLGVDVSAEAFVKAVERYKPDILAMSALLTTTAPELRKVIDALRSGGLRDRVKVIVGGAPINDRFAKEIGADGYSPTAVGAAKLALWLMGKKGAI
jgi:corrinoid protein of di/trimethylamine methyltransferase